MKYKIIGSNKINGEIKISGSKNASLPIIVASILTNEEVILENIPLISDVINMIRLLDSMGVTTKYEYNERKLIIKAKKVKTSVNSEYVKKKYESYMKTGEKLHLLNEENKKHYAEWFQEVIKENESKDTIEINNDM